MIEKREGAIVKGEGGGGMKRGLREERGVEEDGINMSRTEMLNKNKGD